MSAPPPDPESPEYLDYMQRLLDRLDWPPRKEPPPPKPEDKP